MFGDERSMWCGANDGGVKRGDRADTGDLEARPIEDRRRDLVVDGALEELEIRDAHDPSLGLTNIDDVPPGDWAADTGPTRTGENADDDWIEVLPDEPFKPSPITGPANRRRPVNRKKSSG